MLVASVSCIFGLGSPESYRTSVLPLSKSVPADRDDVLRKLIDLQYARNDMDFKRGTFRVRGDVVELHPSYEEFAYRIEFFDDQITLITSINPISGELLGDHDAIFIYPAVHYVMPPDRVESAIASIREEMDHQVSAFKSQAKLLEAQRLLARTKYDLEMIQEVGYCSGIENYSRHLDGRKPGGKTVHPHRLFPEGFPAHYRRIPPSPSRRSKPCSTATNSVKPSSSTTVFRLPSAMDNRPLRFEEFVAMTPQVIYVSATPAPYELQLTQGEVVEQIIRPTGLVDPTVLVCPAQGQVPHLLDRIKERVAKNERILVTTLTKRLAEDLSGYIQEAGFKCRYLHSDILTLERVEILTDLRKGDFDVLIGVNLLREGLDLPEVSMVAILDADKAGFLRSETSLIQTIGRSARNVNATVYLYADTITPAMQRAIDETDRRRKVQKQFNLDHNITPQTIQKAIRDSLESEVKARRAVESAIHLEPNTLNIAETIRLMEEEMLQAAQSLDFERAAELRDQIKGLKNVPEISGAKHVVEEQPKLKIWSPKGKKPGKR